MIVPTATSIMLIMTEKSLNDMRLAAEFTPSSLGPPLDVVVDAVLASGTLLPELDQVLPPLLLSKVGDEQAVLVAVGPT